MSRVEIRISERAPFAGGHAFEQSGPFERLKGRIRFGVNPFDPLYADIVDLDKAPKNSSGQVECAADVFILRPIDPAKGNRRLFFEFGNRGNKRCLQYFCDAPGSNDPIALQHAGNGFLFRRGYTIAWVAWQGDLLPGSGRMILKVPVASESSKPITGLVRTELITSEPGHRSFPLSGYVSTHSYPTAFMDTRKAKLTRRRYATSEREGIAADAWTFARVEGGAGIEIPGQEVAVVPSRQHIYIPTGFEPGWIYEIIYTARDPLVLGLGNAVVRDAVSFLRYGDKDATGKENPLNGRIDKAYAWGRSQTGRAIRDFVNCGYNADADGRRVFDGVLPHVSGCGLMWMNHRFARVVNPAGQQYEDHHNIADRFPFSYALSTNHLTGKTDAILKRPQSDPLVIHTQSATEYWQRRGSLVHTDTKGNDLEQPENVRCYLWASSQHLADPLLEKPTRSPCQNYLNVVSTSMLFRAMLDAMDRWASEGKPPPPSRVPRRADGTLVSFEEWRERFPKIPGLMLPLGPNRLPLLDYGPEADKGIISKEPPKVVDPQGYAVQVPAPDEDGNDLGGVLAPMAAVPLGTYTGWNLRARGLGHGAMYLFNGSYIPFPETPEERDATGDPRRSILKRYGHAGGYMRAIEAAARKLVAEGFMLEEDVARSVDAARNFGRPRHDVKL
ncbi:MAG TPA: alpha/beta hydrolase domain-containing protein [Gammaproteobacteria bacterium]|nr:alpha/beta hydrolase domain-containing protein [Gammaproteobacteria bacterium]